MHGFANQDKPGFQERCHHSHKDTPFHPLTASGSKKKHQGRKICSAPERPMGSGTRRCNGPWPALQPDAVESRDMTKSGPNHVVNGHGLTVEPPPHGGPCWPRRTGMPRLASSWILPPGQDMHMVTMLSGALPPVLQPSMWWTWQPLSPLLPRHVRTTHGGTFRDKQIKILHVWCKSFARKCKMS